MDAYYKNNFTIHVFSKCTCICSRVFFIIILFFTVRNQDNNICTYIIHIVFKRQKHLILLFYMASWTHALGHSGAL